MPIGTGREACELDLELELEGGHAKVAHSGTVASQLCAIFGPNKTHLALMRHSVVV